MLLPSSTAEFSLTGRFTNSHPPQLPDIQETALGHETSSESESKSTSSWTDVSVDDQVSDWQDIKWHSSDSSSTD
jgi:hypothetical protein